MKSRLLLIAGACLCAVGLSACCSQPKQSEPVKKEVGIQLYSVRELIGVFGKSEGDYKPVLQALAEMGYTSVEAASYKDGLIYGQTPEQFRQDVEAAGMKVLSIAKPVLKPHDISSALFEVKLISSQPRQLLEEWNAFLDRSEILTEKKSKKGMKTVDIRPDISVTASEMTENAFCLSLVLPAGPEKNISPLLVLDAFSKISSVQPEHTSVLKKAVYDKSGKLFR